MDDNETRGMKGRDGLAAWRYEGGPTLGMGQPQGGSAGHVIGAEGMRAATMGEQEACGASRHSGGHAAGRKQRWQCIMGRPGDGKRGSMQRGRDGGPLRAGSASSALLLQLLLLLLLL